MNYNLRRCFMYKITFICLIYLFTKHIVSEELDIKMKPVINLALAKAMANACEADQKKSGYIL